MEIDNPLLRFFVENALCFSVVGAAMIVFALSFLLRTKNKPAKFIDTPTSFYDAKHGPTRTAVSSARAGGSTNPQGVGEFGIIRRISGVFSRIDFDN